MKLSIDQVKKVAKLANLPISDEEEEKYSEQLSKILDYVEQLNQVDTSKIEPTFNVTGKTNVMAKDEVVTSLSASEATHNAKATQEGFFVTKGVFNNE